MMLIPPLLSRGHFVARAFGSFSEIVEKGLESVRDVLHEQQRQDVILLLRGIHPTAQLIAALPQRAVKL